MAEMPKMTEMAKMAEMANMDDMAEMAEMAEMSEIISHHKLSILNVLLFNSANEPINVAITSNIRRVSNSALEEAENLKEFFSQEN